MRPLELFKEEKKEALKKYKSFGLILGFVLTLVLGGGGWLLFHHSTTYTPIEDVYPELADPSIPLPEGFDNIVTEIDSDGNSHRRVVQEEPSLWDNLFTPFAEGDWAKETIPYVVDMSDGKPDIVNDSYGNLHICVGAYKNSGPPANSTIWYGKYNGSWNLEIVDNGANLNDVGRYCSIAINSTDKISIAYYDNTADDLRFATGEYMHWQNETLDTGGNVGSYPSITINSTDDALISYYDSTNTALKVASGSYGHWQTETVDNTAEVGTYTSIAINSTDDALISYYDTTNGDLKGAYGSYGDWTLETIDNGVTGSTGTYSSIVVNSTNNLHISYRADCNPDGGVVDTCLKYSTGSYGHWNTQFINYLVGFDSGSYTSIDNYEDNISITYLYESSNDLKITNGTLLSWTNDTVDSAGTVGAHNSQIVVNGTVHVVYFDDTNNKIKHASRELFLPYGGGGGGAPAGWWNYYENVSYENPSASGDTVNFNITLNYSVVDNPAADVTFTYNGTVYNPNVVEQYQNISVWSIDVTVPTVTSTQTVPVWWNGTDIDTFGNTTVKYHTISALELTDCSDGGDILVLNVTHQNESIPFASVNVRLDINFQLREVDGVTSTQTFNFSSAAATSHAYCMPANISNYVTADVEMTYYDDAGLYSPRFYYLVNTSFDLTANTTETVSTYSLTDYESVTFELELFNHDFSGLPGYYIQTMRYYPEELAYKTVEVSRTDENSKTINKMKLENVYYRFSVIDEDGVSVQVTDVFRPFCTAYPCTKNVFVQDTSAEYDLWSQYAGITYNLSFNGTGTNLVSYTYVDGTGATSWSRLVVTYRSGTNDTEICNTTLNAAAGTILCNLTAYLDTNGDYFANAYISRSPAKWYAQIVVTFQNAYLVYGTEGVFFAMLLFGVIALSALWNPTAALVMSPFGLIVIRFMGWVYIPFSVIVAAVVIAAVLIWRTQG